MAIRGGFRGDKGNAMKLKVKSETFGGHPIWGVYERNGLIRIDFYSRKTKDKDGLPRETLIEILKEKGHEVS